jgi:hypothetical protein
MCPGVLGLINTELHDIPYVDETRIRPVSVSVLSNTDAGAVTV